MWYLRTARRCKFKWFPHVAGNCFSQVPEGFAKEARAHMLLFSHSNFFLLPVGNHRRPTDRYTNLTWYHDLKASNAFTLPNGIYKPANPASN